MALKILCIGDQHFKPSNIPQVDIFIQKLEGWLDKNPVDLIISMGDLLHTHERLHTQAFNKAVQYVELISKYAEVPIMAGNHDFCNNSAYLTPNHWLTPLKKYSNVIVVDDVTIIERKGVKITLCPYVPDGKFRMALDTKKGEWEDSDCIFAHQLFDGAKMGAIVAEDVEKWDDDDPMLFCAHIHDSQWVQDNMYIVGSAMQEAFGESEDKTLLLLTLEKDDMLDKTTLLDDKGKFTLIDLDLPKKRILYMEMDELEEFNLDTLKENVEYKLTVDGDQEEFDAFKKTTKYKSLIKKVKIVFKHKRTFLTEKRERTDDGISSIRERPEAHKKFNKILEELVEQESNPYITDLFNSLVLQRTGEKEEMLFL
ncbi:MAG: metallophosphoesterase [Candidatus Colwellbacteria bacterium]|nr:metallophosphoesterase [Candidatus Colwellbacteria bacterium]